MTSATVFTSCTKGVDYAYKESALNHMKSGTAWPIFTCPTNYVKCTAKDKSSADGMELD